MTRGQVAGVALIALGLLTLTGPAAAVLWMHRMYTTGVSLHGQIGLLVIGAFGLLSIVAGVWVVRLGERLSAA